MVLGHHGPAIRQQPHVGLAAVDHRFDGEGHAFSQFKTRASATVVPDLRIFVDDATDAVAAVFAADRKARSAERRVGTEGGSTGRDRWGPTHKKKKTKQQY